MRVITDYILDLKLYPVSVDAVEKALESPTMKEVLEKNLLRGEFNPKLPDNDNSRYFIIDPKNTRFLTTDLVLNKEKKELSMTIAFDSNDIGSGLQIKLNLVN